MEIIVVIAIVLIAYGALVYFEAKEDKSAIDVLVTSVFSNKMTLDMTKSAIEIIRNNLSKEEKEIIDMLENTIDRTIEQDDKTLELCTRKMSEKGIRGLFTALHIGKDEDENE